MLSKSSKAQAGDHRAVAARATDQEIVKKAAMLADAYDCVVFDCDGVLWSGGETVAQAKATLDALKAQNKKVYFMSNNSSRGPDVFRQVFESHGLGEHVKDERFMWNSVTAAQRWFKSSKAKKAYVVGCAALKDAIRGAGVQVVEPGNRWARHQKNLRRRK